MGWDERRDVLRIMARNVTPHRSRKDTRRWCRGKVGVKHVTEVRQAHGHYGARPCYRTEWWIEQWWCNHQLVCVKCNKIMRHDLGTDCPDYTPEITWRRTPK